METETVQLIEQLALKLGTTSEYLWAVLLKQAPIYALTGSIEIVGTFLFGGILLLVHLYLSKESPGGHSKYYKYEWLMIPMVLSSVIWTILVITAFFCISTVITALVNPEYWALNEVLKHL